MDNFKKGHVYVVKSGNGYWYTVRQTGMKSWVALNLGNIGVHKEDLFKTGNSIKLWQLLNVSQYRVIKDDAFNNKDFRKLCFNVLKYGSFEEK